MEISASAILKERIGDRLKSLREERNLSQADLADKAGCSRATVINIESGNQMPTLDFVYEISKVLDSPYLSLLPTEEEMSKIIEIKRAVTS